MTNVAVGDTVILHPITDVRAVPRVPRAATTCTASASAFPGIYGSDGGFAEYLLTTSARGA